MLRVTEVLLLAGLRDDLALIREKEWYLQRGTMNHRAIALMNEGRLNWATLDPRIIPYVRAAEKFRQDFGGVLVAQESELIDPVEDIVGHQDAIYRSLRIRGSRRTDLTLVDWKTGSCHPTTAIQTWKYARMWEKINKRKIKWRCGVALLATGDYKVDWYANDAADGKAWKTALQVARNIH